jgi:molecular chaperone GrpE
MKKEGGERINSLGEKFDPDFHDAMMQIESEEYPPGTVAVEMAAGYKLKGKVIRHARVGVSKGGATAAENNEA